MKYNCQLICLNPSLLVNIKSVLENITNCNEYEAYATIRHKITYHQWVQQMYMLHQQHMQLPTFHYAEIHSTKDEKIYERIVKMTK